MTTLHNVALKIENENRWKVHIEKMDLKFKTLSSTFFANSILDNFC